MIHDLNGLDGSDEYANNDSAFLENDSNANPDKKFASKGTSNDNLASPLLPSDIEGA